MAQNPSDLPYRELTDQNCFEVMMEALRAIQTRYEELLDQTTEDSIPPMKPVIRLHEGDEKKFFDMLTSNIHIESNSPVEKPQAGLMMVGVLRGVPIYAYPQVPPDEVWVYAFSPKTVYRFKLVKDGQ